MAARRERIGDWYVESERVPVDVSWVDAVPPRGDTAPSY